jgi:hypothetical protein
MIDNLIDPTHSGHAGLSQNFLHQAEDLFTVEEAALDQAHRHSQVFDQLFGRVSALLRLRRGLRRPNSATALIEQLFSFPSFLAPVIGHATPDRFASPVFLATTKGTTQVLTPHSLHVFAPGVAGIGEKEHPAMPAALEASSQVGLAFQGRPQQQVILQHHWTGLFPVAPVLTELEMLFDLCCKKA